MPARPTRLRALLRERHWQSYQTFCAEYEKAAKAVDPRLQGSAPSRAQLHRWLTGELTGLPYGDHCRILEQMFPGWSAAQLFSAADADEERAAGSGDIRLLLSGGELNSALIEIVRSAETYLVAVGSRSSQPAYLHEIELAVAARPSLVHYRILMGPPHSEILRDHLANLLRIRRNMPEKSLYISLVTDLTRNHERFFVTNERAAVIALPSAHSPGNFDTGLLVNDPQYLRGLFQHGQALYGRPRLDTVEALAELTVLG